MKLALSIISSFLCAVAATSFFRVGIFALGSLAFGGTAYVAFDAFPYLDPGSILFAPNNITSATGIGAETQGMLLTSDLSAVAWVITLFCAAAGGIFLRYFEMETLEIATATIGGIGCAYSAHTVFMVVGKPVDPALIFLLAFFTSVGGWNFQRRRRLRLQNIIPGGTVIECRLLEQQRQMEESTKLLLQSRASPQQSGQDGLIMGGAVMERRPVEQHRQMGESMLSLLQSQASQQQSGLAGPSSEQISDLTSSINRFINALEEGKNVTKEKERGDKEVSAAFD